MDRKAFLALCEWKKKKNRLPLLLRGARQVGKTHLVEQFGRDQFTGLISINLELQPEYMGCFESLHPKDILNRITIINGQPIIPGQTLLFFDEIQECPRAILAMRYFKEQLPELHVIGAGSLLEFVLNDQSFRMPVGRIEFLYLRPFSFQEYLNVFNHHALIGFLKEADLKTKIPDVIHQQSLKLLREYMVIGGMPAVVNEYLQNSSFYDCQRLQTALLNTYRNDFGKYSQKTNHKYLQKVFETSPNLIGQQIKYSKIDAELRSRDLKEALLQLEQAGLIAPVYATSASGLPLNALLNLKKFKLLFLDIGLLHRATHLNIEILLKDNLLLINRGAFAEQFVGQELLAYSDMYEDKQLFFWEREKVGSQAEIDFVIQLNGDIIPLEVKSGTTGRLKSLRLFMQEKSSKLGVRISQQPLNFTDGILSVPLYMINELPRLIEIVKHP